jgi:hypothetical protein
LDQSILPHAQISAATTHSFIPVEENVHGNDVPSHSNRLARHML